MVKDYNKKKQERKTPAVMVFDTLFKVRHPPA
jgi:hypothetical protein